MRTWTRRTMKRVPSTCTAASHISSSSSSHSTAVSTSASSVAEANRMKCGHEIAPPPASDNDLFCQQGSRHKSCFPRLWLVGASKCATSSLALHISANPSVQIRCGGTKSNVSKEPTFIQLSDRVQYSSCDGSREVHVYDWHRSDDELFALEESMSVPMLNGALTSMEYTPNYLSYPATPQRIYDTSRRFNDQFPARLRFMIMLREPVSRTLSSFWAKGGTGIPDAISTLDGLMTNFKGQEACNTARNTSASVECGSDGHGAKWSTADHVGKSVYAPQFERWFRHFSRCQFYITTMEAFFTHGDDVRDDAYINMLTWAGLPVGYERHERDMVLRILLNPTHSDAKVPLPDDYMRKLKGFFEPYNQKLATLLGSDQVLRDWA